jgi:hypothetical protein
LFAGDSVAEHVSDPLGAEFAGERAQRGKVLGDRRRRTAVALKQVAVGAHGLGVKSYVVV